MDIKYLFPSGIMTLALLFSCGAISAEPAYGHFDFATKKPTEDHYFSIRTQPIFGKDRFGRNWTVGTGFMKVNTYSKQTVGVNVYWKTKGYDANRGRQRYTPYQSRLPRCAFTAEKQCGAGKTFSGSSEHLEGLVYSESGVENNSLIQGNVPDVNHRVTRFFDYRYGFHYTSFGGLPSPNSGEDENVNLGVSYFTQNEDGCKTEFCHGTMNNPTPGYIYIPTNRLEYLVIEVIGIESANLPMDKNDGFYTFPVIALKYVSTGNGKQMKLYRSDRNYPDASRDTPGSTVSTAIYKKFKTIPTGTDYYDSGDSNIHGNAEIIDFKDIDTLNITLKYNNAFPDGHPQENGIAVDVGITNLRCATTDKKCSYPTAY